MKKAQLYSAGVGHNKSTSHLTAGSSNIKSHLSKKMIKNYVKTQRDKDQMTLKYEYEKNRNQINEKKLNTYRKGVCSRDK